jgi:Ni/Fe-hydrogenase subunit HybB-like protein
MSDTYHVVNVPGNYIPPELKGYHGYKPGNVKWAVLTLVVIPVLIFVWWAMTPTPTERAALDATATAVAVGP